jgi:hypothetical protein
VTRETALDSTAAAHPSRRDRRRCLSILRATEHGDICVDSGDVDERRRRQVLDRLRLSCRLSPRSRSSGWSLSNVSHANAHRRYRSKINILIRKHPFLLFGLPFLATMVGGSFLLATFTRARYDLHDSKNYQISKEDELHMRKDRRKIDIREEYFVCRRFLPIFFFSML